MIMFASIDGNFIFKYMPLIPLYCFIRSRSLSKLDLGTVFIKVSYDRMILIMVISIHIIKNNCVHYLLQILMININICIAAICIHHDVLIVLN